MNTVAGVRLAEFREGLCIKICTAVMYVVVSVNWVSRKGKIFMYMYL